MNTPEPADAADAGSAAYAMLDPRARDVLDCWFGAPDAAVFGTDRKQWFARDHAFDAMLRDRFSALIDTGIAGQLDAWETTPLGALALIIVLDQFSRNCRRNTPAAFAGDAAALRIAQRMVESGADRQLPSAYHRGFAYIPFTHDESLASQHESLRLYQLLDAEQIDPSYYRSAVRHAKVIERFGRYPHRNALLGRPSTDEEIAFLREPGSSF